MAQTAKQYFEQLFQEAGYSPEEITTLTAKLTDAKISGKLDSLVKTATEDYNAQLGRVRAAEEKMRAWQEWAEGNPQANRPGAVAQYNQLLEAYNTQASRLQAIEAAAGVAPPNPANGAPPANGNGTAQYLTLADLTKFTQDLDTRWSGALKQSNLITGRHNRAYGEDPDFDAIQKIAGDNGWSNLPNGMTLAYEKWIEPRETKRKEEAQEKWKADTRAELERDIRTRYNVPTVEAAPTDYAPLFNGKDKDLSGADLDSALVATWNDSAKK